MKPAAPPPAAPLSPLAQLNAYIAQASQAAREVEGAGVVGAAGADAWPELRSAQRFRETWERIGAETQVEQAQARAPQNAGPLNPERLILNTLARMGACSPHYLRRFMAHMETLMWLEQGLGQLKAAGAGKGKAAKPGKTGRQKK